MTTHARHLRKNMLVLGTQWGDEGKGKVTHYLSRHVDLVARYAGGPNAGHTVVIGSEVYKLHHIPSGIFFEHVTCTLGNGMVIDAAVLLDEIEGLKGRGLPMANLRISPGAHLILPYHRVLDGLHEEGRGAQSLGTTRRGVGPAYVDKVSRAGIRVADLLDAESLADRIAHNFREKAHQLAGSDLDARRILSDCLEHGERLRPYVADVSLLLCQAAHEGRRILFEGAQGALLDVDLGTYPYVTSSNAGPGYAGAGLGVPPRAIEHVLGVVKAYTTRVGAGPFPTELHDEVGDRLRRQGHEFGTTTGRPRRCGWLDAVALRTACRMHGVDSLCVTKLDVLSGFPSLDVAVAYERDGETLTEFPLTAREVENCTPVCRRLGGWEESLEGVERWEDLPVAALRYLAAIEEILGLPVEYVSLGARDDRMVVSPARRLPGSA